MMRLFRAEMKGQGAAENCERAGVDDCNLKWLRTTESSSFNLFYKTTYFYEVTTYDTVHI